MYDIRISYEGCSPVAVAAEEFLVDVEKFIVAALFAVYALSAVSVFFPSLFI